MWYLIIAQALWFVLPAYIANGSAVLVGGGRPIDSGKNWRDNRRILGDGKTWRGLFVGAFVGMTAGFGLAAGAMFILESDFAFVGISDFGAFPVEIPIIFSICFGALMGDIVESFFKRRIGKERGEDWIPFDQLDFILGALVSCFIMSLILQVVGLTAGNWFLDNLNIWHILFLLLVTPFFHILANILHKRDKVKNMVK